MCRRICVLMVAIIVSLSSRAFAWPIVNGSVEQKALFVRGVENNVYEVPALYTTAKGTVLAFCEAREGGGVTGDTGNIDTVMRRSENGGKTWSSMQVIWNEGRNVCGNPCIVQDSKTGTIWLLMTWNRREDGEGKIISGRSKDVRRPYICYSNDEGKTWSKPKDLSETCRESNWTWYATGPGRGIQLQRGVFKGRLVIPCDHIVAGGHDYFSHIIYSDDHGATWKIGGSVPDKTTSECQVVELVDGTLYMNIRNHFRKTYRRAISLSEDGGMTWSKPFHDQTLITPHCHASVIRYSHTSDHAKNRLLFSNPANEKKRFDLTVRVSYDEGKTWPVAKKLFDGYSGYSSLTVLPNGDIGCLYQAGDDPVRNWNEAAIYFARFPLEWIEEGKK